MPSMQSRRPSQQRRSSLSPSPSPSPSAASPASAATSRPEPQPQSQTQSQRARSESSEDSQTVLVNRSAILGAGEQQKEADRESSVAAPSPSRPPQDEADVKKCWICFADETEDTADSSEWRDPCPCALVAHEDCLLDWIADMESPSSRKRTLSPPRPVCPQCKSDIYLARPKNYLVEAVKAFERVAAKVTTPGVLMLALSAVVNACEAHGRYTIFTIFGPTDGFRIMQPVLNDMVHPHRLRGWVDLKNIFGDFATHWRLRLGLPLITPILVLSRTSFIDSLLPVLPIVFFATAGDSDEPIDFASWPPSASLTMAVLPYLRGAYNAYYERVWAAKEKRWLKEIQPRNGRENADPNNPIQDEEEDDHVPVAQGDNNFEVRIDAGFWNGLDDVPVQEPDLPRAQAAPPLNAPPLADDAGGAQPRAQRPQQQRQQGQRQQQQNPPAPNNREERLLSLNTNALAEKLLGALIFPTVASVSGELLRYVLPRAWTTKPSLGAGRATGLLQEKWGRSIVGGCLFVVVKDAVMLYVRWKMASQHRRRRVLDYEHSKAKVKK